jgi:hypothetical protein
MAKAVMIPQGNGLFCHYTSPKHPFFCDEGGRGDRNLAGGSPAKHSGVNSLGRRLSSIYIIRLSRFAGVTLSLSKGVASQPAVIREDVKIEPFCRRERSGSRQAKP